MRSLLQRLKLFLNKILNFISDTITRSGSDETEATIEQMPREHLTPPHTPSTTIRQNHESSSFFSSRRRRHHHHHHRHRLPARVRGYEVR